MFCEPFFLDHLTPPPAYRTIPAVSIFVRKGAQVEDQTRSLSEVAGLMGVSERTVRRWIKGGRLKAYKPGRDYRIPEGGLRAFIEESEISPKDQAPLQLELEEQRGDNEERHGSNDVWRAEYLARGNEMLDKWEDELEEEIALAESDLDHFFEWLQEIREFGNPYINGLISAYSATARSNLEVTAGAAKFLGPYNDLWLRIEKHLDQTTKLSEEDEKRFRELYEEAVAVH